MRVFILECLLSYTFNKVEWKIVLFSEVRKVLGTVELFKFGKREFDDYASHF